MPQVTKVGRVVVPVSDQDEAIAFYTRVLGFRVTDKFDLRNIPKFSEGQHGYMVRLPHLWQRSPRSRHGPQIIHGCLRRRGAWDNDQPDHLAG